MQVVIGVVCLQRPGNQLRAGAHKQVLVAVVRNERDAVAPVAVAGGRVIGHQLIHHLVSQLSGAVRVGLFARRQAHRHPAHANIHGLGVEAALVPLALLLIQQGEVVFGRIAGRAVAAHAPVKRRKRLP